MPNTTPPHDTSYKHEANNRARCAEHSKESTLHNRTTPPRLTSQVSTTFMFSRWLQTLRFASQDRGYAGVPGTTAPPRRLPRPTGLALSAINCRDTPSPSPSPSAPTAHPLLPLLRTLPVETPGDSATNRLSAGLAGPGPAAIARRRFLGPAEGELIGKLGLPAMRASAGIRPLDDVRDADPDAEGEVGEATLVMAAAAPSSSSIEVRDARPLRRLDDRTPAPAPPNPMPPPGRFCGVSPTSTPALALPRGTPPPGAAAARRRLRAGVALALAAALADKGDALAASDNGLRLLLPAPLFVAVPLSSPPSPSPSPPTSSPLGRLRLRRGDCRIPAARASLEAGDCWPFAGPASRKRRVTVPFRNAYIYPHNRQLCVAYPERIVRRT